MRLTTAWSLVVVLAALATLVAAPVAEADPLQSRRAEADAVMAEIHQLDANVGLAVEEYNAAQVRLDKIQADQRRNQRHVAIARSSLRRAQRSLENRLVALYKRGDTTVLEILLGADNLDDFLARAETVDRVSADDARVVREIRAFRNEVKRREAQLRKARAEQEDLVAELDAKRREIEAQLAERRALLASIRDEIERIEAAEARRQAEAEQRARARLAAAPPESSSGGGGGATTSSGDYVSSEATSEAAPPPRHGGVVGIAMQYLGVPYRWGGASPSTGFDCSGFVMYVYSQVGVSLPHNAAMQYGYGTPVSRSQLAPGDLVFFNGLGHNGIYIGGGQFIHSPHTGDVVKISSMTGWYADTYVGARRL
ncbi:MAG TPA: NlpC/P60 family protein [Gaiellaceae bacterium]|nr:NlpC/P60 family protein [Gaiellaceae bacterium]